MDELEALRARACALLTTMLIAVWAPRTYLEPRKLSCLLIIKLPSETVVPSAFRLFGPPRASALVMPIDPSTPSPGSTPCTRHTTSDSVVHPATDVPPIISHVETRRKSGNGKCNYINCLRGCCAVKGTDSAAACIGDDEALWPALDAVDTVRRDLDSV